VEDTPDNRRVISYSLKRLGLVVETAENGELGVERVLAEPEGFDLVLMDISMPVMDGRQAVKILRERKFTLPIVALTAHALEEERERCLREGFDEYLAKPFSSRDLKTILERVWTKREERVSKPKVRDESDLEVGPIGEFLPS
jgi:CheY-like chemotaxis protein